MPRPVEKACAFGALIGMTKLLREATVHHVFIFIKPCSAKKITRAAFSGAGCQRTAGGYGLGRWGYGLGRCQLGSNQFENFLEFLGVEMLKIRGVLCFVPGAASDIFGGGRCRRGSRIWGWMGLTSQTWGSLLRIRFLLSSTIFYAKSDTYIFLHIPKVHEAHQRWHQSNQPQEPTTGTNSELSLNLNASFTILPNKKAKIWSKSQGSPIFGRFFHIIFWTDFFPQLPEPPGSEARGTPEAPRRRHPPGGRGRRRPGHAALPPCGSGARARERFGWPAASKNLVELLVPGGVVGGRCQKIQHSQVWC